MRLRLTTSADLIRPLLIRPAYGAAQSLPTTYDLAMVEVAAEATA